MEQKPFSALALLAPLLLITIFHLPSLQNADARPVSHKPIAKVPFGFLKDFVGCKKGDTVQGVRQVKKYLHQFGYMDYDVNELDTTSAGATGDVFDRGLESALKTYQLNYNLPVTGTLDAETVKQMMKPRCGVPDIINGTTSMRSGKQHHHSSSKFHAVLHYSFFPGMPKWPPSQTHLTYAFVSNDQRNSELRSIAAQAFGKWAAVSQFTFEEVDSGSDSDIKIGFYSGDHGDGRPFDGPLGVLAHAFRPTIGLFHLDGDEMWSTSPGPNDIDLESVTIHEIGHLLGLGHTSVPGAVMAPSIASGATVRDLQEDDIDGIMALYNM